MTLIPTDATLGVSGRPQSATGQAAILTGKNMPALIGEHYGPKPNPVIRQIIQAGNLFQNVVKNGGQAALITPYPEPFFAAVKRGKRLLSAVPLAVESAGISLMNATDLRQGRAVSPGFTNKAWRNQLGYDDMPLFTLPQAGEQITKIAQNYHFSFFEHWPSDRLGHRGTLREAIEHLELLDKVIGSLIASWQQYNSTGLLIITSDHGNIEEKNHRHHTRNPVPTILVGENHEKYAGMIHDLTDIASVVREKLNF